MAQLASRAKEEERQCGQSTASPNVHILKAARAWRVLKHYVHQPRPSIRVSLARGLGCRGGKLRKGPLIGGNNANNEKRLLSVWRTKCKRAMTREERVRWKEEFAHPAVQGRADLAKVLLERSDLSATEIIKSLQAAAPGTRPIPSVPLDRETFNAAGAAAGKHLLGKPTINDQDDPTSEADKQRFEQFEEAIRKAKEEEDDNCPEELRAFAAPYAIGFDESEYKAGATAAKRLLAFATIKDDLTIELGAAVATQGLSDEYLYLRQATAEISSDDI
jgi:hypothetical protein